MLNPFPFLKNHWPGTGHQIRKRSRWHCQSSSLDPHRLGPCPNPSYSWGDSGRHGFIFLSGTHTSLSWDQLYSLTLRTLMDLLELWERILERGGFKVSCLWLSEKRHMSPKQGSHMFSLEPESFPYPSQWWGQSFSNSCYFGCPGNFWLWFLSMSFMC